jgi:hypothetical protein
MADLAGLNDFPDILGNVFAQFDRPEAVAFANRMARSGDLNIIRWTYPIMFLGDGAILGDLDPLHPVGSDGYKFLATVVTQASDTVDVYLLDWVCQVTDPKFFYSHPHPISETYTDPEGNIAYRHGPSPSIVDYVVWKAVRGEGLPVLHLLRARNIGFVVTSESLHAINSADIFKWLDAEHLLNMMVTRRTDLQWICFESWFSLNCSKSNFMEMRVARQLTKRKTHYHENMILNHAVKHNNLGILNWLFSSSYKASLELTSGLMALAMERRNKWLQENNCPSANEAWEERLADTMTPSFDVPSTVEIRLAITAAIEWVAGSGLQNSIRLNG